MILAHRAGDDKSMDARLSSRCTSVGENVGHLVHLNSLIHILWIHGITFLREGTPQDTIIIWWTTETQVILGHGEGQPQQGHRVKHTACSPTQASASISPNYVRLAKLFELVRNDYRCCGVCWLNGCAMINYTLKLDLKCKGPVTTTKIPG